MDETWFVDVAAVRIQTWLARSARVRYRRGASFRLADLTAPDYLGTEILPAAARVRPNTEAGALSGVASLRFAADGLSEQEAHAIALESALSVARHLRAVFPALPLRATWGRGPYYVQVYAGDMRSRKALFDLPATPQEGIVARPCGMCRTSRAVHEKVEIVGDAVDLCVDCYSRVAWSPGGLGVAGWTSADSPPALPKAQERLHDDLPPTRSRHTSRKRLPKAQERLHQDLSEIAGMNSCFPDDFGDLASWVARVEGDAATQLCTVFADGNRIGVLMKKIADHLTAQLARDPADADKVAKKRAGIVAGITTATRKAVGKAAAATAPLVRPAAQPTDAEGEPRHNVPALVHLADGDDILMTVPAPAGWIVVRELANAFAAEMTTLLTELGIPEEVGSFSLSMGMVFHHATHPIADVVLAAEELLSSAKTAVRGEESSVAFVDLTSDGETSQGVREFDRDKPRRPLTIRELTAWSAALDEVASVEASQRANLVQLLREAAAESRSPGSPASPGGLPSATGLTPDGGAREALARRVKVLARPEILALVGGNRNGPRTPPAPGNAAAQQGRLDRVCRALGTLEPSARDDLRLWLDVARWWPVPSRGADPATPDDTALTLDAAGETR